MDGSHQKQLQIETVRKGAWFQFRSPANFRWTRATVPVPGIAPSLNGLRLIQLTDLHFRPYWTKGHDQVLQAVRDAKPDLIFVTGDFVDCKWDRRAAVPFVKRFLDGLEARAGIYGVLGNHDTDFMSTHLTEGNLTLLYRSHAELHAHDGTVELIGVPAVGRYDLDDEFLRQIPPHDPKALRIALTHYPDHILRLRELHPHMVFAGHTHGGQVCLPGGRPLVTHDSLPRHTCCGVHRYEDIWLIVSRGIGFSTLPFRTFCPSEVIEIIVQAI